MLEMVARQGTLNFPPGDEYSYTSTNYFLLAILVERVSGVSLEQFTKSRVFDPLGMTHTRWRDDFTRIEKGRATAYEPAAGGTYLPSTRQHSTAPLSPATGGGTVKRCSSSTTNVTGQSMTFCSRTGPSVRTPCVIMERTPMLAR